MGKNYLIAIGIDSYRKQPPLSSPVGDAKAFRDALWDRYGFHNDRTVWLSNQDATYEAILGALKTFAHDEKKHLKSDDALVIYFAGHGQYDPVTEEISILPHEGNDTLPKSTYIPYSEIKSHLGEIKAKQVLFISDACYSGGLLKGFYANFNKEKLDFLTDRFELTARQAISSGGLETVTDKGFRGHSVFCHFILKTLEENVAEALPASVLFLRVHNGAKQNTRPEPKLGTMFGAAGEGGEFVFRRKFKDGDEKAGLHHLNPYKGLRAFGLEDSEYFGGRDQVAVEIYERLQTRNLVGIIGASGSGKSSLALAGVCPIILEKQPEWALLKLRIGDKPIESLFYALDLWAFPNDRVDQPIRFERFQTNLKNDERALYHYLKSRTQEVGQTPVCVLDQWEELYTICRRPEDRDAFIANVTHAAQEDALRVLLTVRADFYDQLLLSKSGFFELLKPGLIDLRPMSEEELRQAIQKPASIADLEFAEGLIDRLISAVEGENGHLPILQFALSELWQNRDRASNTISHEVYEELGGLSGVIKKQADRVITEELNEDENNIARLTLPSLVHVGDHGNDVKLREALSSYSSDQQSVLRKLSGERCRLVTIDRAPDSTNPGKETEYVELAHEELIRSWPTLTNWLDEDIEFHKQRSRLQSAHMQYLEKDEDEDFLLPEGKPLEDAKFLQEAYGDRQFSSDLMAFVETSSNKWEQRRLEALKHEKRQAKQERDLRIAAEDSTRRARRGTVIAVCLFVVALVGSAVAWNYYLVAEHNRELATLREMEAETATEETMQALGAAQEALFQRQIVHAGLRTSQAKTLLREGLPDQALAVMLDGFPEDLREHWSEFVGSSDAALRINQALVESRVVYRIFGQARWEHSGERHGMGSASFSPDGTRIVTAQRGGGGIAVRNTLTGHKIHEIDGPTAYFTDSGQYLILSSRRLVDAETGGEIDVFDPNAKISESARRSRTQLIELPNGNPVVVAINRGAAQIFDAISGNTLVSVMHERTDEIQCYVDRVHMSPKQGFFATDCGGSGEVRIWTFATGEHVTHLRRGFTTGGRRDNVFHNSKGSSFSPDEKMFLTVLEEEDHYSRNNPSPSLIIWDIETGNEIYSLQINETNLPGRRDVTHAYFSPDGQYIIADTRGGNIYVWRVNDGSLLHVLSGHDGQLHATDFSTKGGLFVSAGIDNSVRLWSLVSGEEITTFLGHSDKVVSAFFSPNGERILTSSDDGSAILWDAFPVGENLVLQGHAKTVVTSMNITISPDGSRYLTTLYDNTARVWSTASGTEQLVLLGHEGLVTSAVFSPDGEMIATGSDDGTVRLWNARTGIAIWTSEISGGGVGRVTFLPDGTGILSAPYDGRLRILDAFDGAEISSFTAERSGQFVSQIEVSPDGQKILTLTGHGRARMWNIKTGEELFRLNGHSAPIRYVSFSPNGRQIVTASDDMTARIWSASNGEELAVLRGHEANLHSAVFSPDGGKILTASADRTARVWDSHSHVEIFHFSEPLPVTDGGPLITSAYFWPNDNNRVWLFHSGKGHIRVRSTQSLEDLIDISRRTAERAQALSDERICSLQLNTGVCN